MFIGGLGFVLRIYKATVSVTPLIFAVERPYAFLELNTHVYYTV
jgi:hypothetical protein